MGTESAASICPIDDDASLTIAQFLMNLFILSYFDVDVGTAGSLWSGWTKDNFAISGRLNITRDIGREGRESNGAGGEKKNQFFILSER